jgi:hypothetical protein
MRFHTSLPFVLALSFAIGRVPADSSVDVDHLILAINRLDRGIEEFTRRTGVVPQRGGQHPGRGTENALVSLGGGHYLELLAPIASAPDSGSAIPFLQLTPAGWALHTSGIADLVARLRTAGFRVGDPTPGSRQRPDGRLLQWQTAGVTGAGFELAPFLIQWDSGSPHPSTTSPTGCSLERLELSEPQPAKLRRFFEVVGYPAPVQTGSRAMRLILLCPKGRVVFASPPG